MATQELRGVIFIPTRDKNWSRNELKLWVFHSPVPCAAPAVAFERFDSKMFITVVKCPAFSRKNYITFRAEPFSFSIALYEVEGLRVRSFRAGIAARVGHIVRIFRNI